MLKDLSAKYYQKEKERLKKGLVKCIKIVLKKKTKKSKNMAANNIEVLLKMKKKKMVENDMKSSSR